jgi:F-box/leucine-rich repeat protein 10/11
MRNNGSSRPGAVLPGVDSQGYGQSNNFSGSHNMPPSPIDTLASVAAERAEYDNHTEYSNRPSKRARSEALASPLINGAQYSPFVARPATSHIPSMTWGRNVEQQIDAAMAMGNMRQGGPPQVVEQLSAAETLLSLFHSSERSPDQPRSSVEDNNGHFDTEGPAKSIPSLAGSIWNGATTSNSLESTSIPNAYRFGTRADNGVVDKSGQTHTPPDDSSNGLGYGQRQSARDLKEHGSNGVHLGNGVSDLRIFKQLHSPQSLPSEFGDPRISKLHPEHAMKTEDAESAGLGISVQSTMAPPLLGFNGARTRGVDDSQATISTFEEPQNSQMDEETTCAKCGFVANSLTGETVDWIQCEGCQGWLHYACTGFNPKEIKKIDKFFCHVCKKTHGPTTFVRKSARQRTNVDYSSLNEGHFSTVDESQEHRYIKHFKNGTLKHIFPEEFPRMRPENITVERFERLPTLSEPIVIPASLNPRPWDVSKSVHLDEEAVECTVQEDADDSDDLMEVVEDDGQDGLDMVIPEGLTVRRVADLYGAQRPVPVIDVKSQEGDSKKWTVGEWASYYEQPGEKPVRNVISLEVSYSPLGRLLRRPKVVRDLDLQDSVWPEGDRNRRAVKFYVLMSVADCYTDFHIDFGGSSVYYHILKGRKVFFFIPPTDHNLKKYEEWCLSPSQNETFLPDQTKECYRVDLYPGDTMLIPSGWIHSVWTPEDSLVIGGNYLTRLHLGMQIRVTEIEKNTKVAQAFRYPSFQKVMWYTVIKYLEQDPTPKSIEGLLLAGKAFSTDHELWVRSERFGMDSVEGEENYHARFYSPSESSGWTALINFIFRTVLIHHDRLDAISQDTRKKVMASIPKGYGDPLDLARKFAIWLAWKRGNEFIPDWARPDGELPTKMTEVKKQQFQQGPPPEPRKSERKANPGANGGEAGRTSHRLGPKKVVCPSCREKKIACKHVKPEVLAELAGNSSSNATTAAVTSPSGINISAGVNGMPTADSMDYAIGESLSPVVSRDSSGDANFGGQAFAPFISIQGQVATASSAGDSLAQQPKQIQTPKPKKSAAGSNGAAQNGSAEVKRKWGKACVDCRRSKVCILVSRV